MDRPRRAEAVRSAAQDHRVAGLQAKRAGVGRDIGAALVDHADDAERHPHPFDAHAVGAPPRRHDGADRVFEFADRFESRRHSLDARWTQREPVHKGGAGARGLCLGDVLLVGGQDRGAGTREWPWPWRASARFFCAAGASASTRAAARASRPRFRIVTSSLARAGYRLERGVHGLIRRYCAVPSMSERVPRGAGSWRVIHNNPQAILPKRRNVGNRANVVAFYLQGVPVEEPMRLSTTVN